MHKFSNTKIFLGVLLLFVVFEGIYYIFIKPSQVTSFQAANLEAGNLTIETNEKDFPQINFNNHNNQRVNQHLFTANKWSMVYFGFTRCPHVCPTSMKVLESAILQLAPEVISNINVYFISVDPQYDSPEVLAEYVKSYRIDIVGLQSSKEDLDKLMDFVSSHYEQDKSDINHSNSFYLISPQGKLQGRFDVPGNSSKIASQITTFIESKTQL